MSKNYLKLGMLPIILATSLSVANAQLVTTVSGVGMGMIDAGYSGDNGPASLAKLNVPFDVAEDASGNIYFTDKLNHCIRMINSQNVITTIAGTGTAGFSGDGGAATSAQLDRPTAIYLDASGNLYFIDGNGTRIRKINSSGVISSIAGTGTAGYSGDGGPATTAQLSGASDIIVNGSGIYIADASNNRIRLINAGGTINTIAGTGISGTSGDNGPASAANIGLPLGIALDNTGNLFIATDNRIRKVVPGTGIISTIAGDGGTNYTDGPALSRALTIPSDLVVDGLGSVYFAELSGFTSTGRKLRVVSSGAISTIMTGMGFGGHGHGGLQSLAKLNSIRGFMKDHNGDFLLTDPDDSRIVMVCNNTPLTQSATYVRSAIIDNAANPFTVTNRCEVICKVSSTGVAPMAGEVTYKVAVDASVTSHGGKAYAQRHYDVIPLNGMTTATATLTFYYSQNEFDAYNTAVGSANYHLPTGPTDVAGIAAIRISHFNGTGTAPGNYTGTTQILDPIDNKVKWDPVLNRWEITIDVTGMGGFYLQTEDNPVSVTDINARNVGLKVYPTASDSKITIEVSSVGKNGTACMITSLEGKEIQCFTINSPKQEINISHLAPGLYFIKTENGYATKVIRK